MQAWLFSGKARFHYSTMRKLSKIVKIKTLADQKQGKTHLTLANRYLHDAQDGWKAWVLLHLVKNLHKKSENKQTKKKSMFSSGLVKVCLRYWWSWTDPLNCIETILKKRQLWKTFNILSADIGLELIYFSHF